MRTLLVALFLLLVIAAPANAARGVTVGAGNDPGVAVDAAGTAHIAYNGVANGTGEPLMYCAWPRGASRCAPRPIVVDSANPSAQPALVQTGPAPADVTVVSMRKELQVVRSADGGANFAPPAVIGTGPFFEGAFGPNGALALAIRNLDIVNVRLRNLAGPPETVATVDLNPGQSVETAIGFSGARHVLVSGTRTSRTAVSSWSGQGDPNSPANWLGPFNFARSDAYALAGGPRGLLIAQETPAGTRARIVVRKFGERTFGRARSIPGSTVGLITEVSLAQAADGRLVAAWHDSLRDRIYASASRTGTRWTRARLLASRVKVPGGLRVALGPDGRGLVVWDENLGDAIHAARVSAPALLRR